jgi:Lipase (class 3)
MSFKNLLFAFTLLLLTSEITAQNQALKPGFDPIEFLDLLQVIETTHKDSIQAGTVKGLTLKHELLYRSPEMGLKNRWEFWLREDGIGVICIRGTVQHASSWMENFYAAQIPATGNLQINDSTNFKYKLSNDEKAAVHVGWTLGLAHLGPDIKKMITVMNQEKNTTRFIIMGHSQGGALAFLVTSYLHYLSQSNELPAGLNFKTYCSAAPKPGNMYYAYDFDFITRNGKAFTVVNTADWVPESPFTVQIINDFNSGNPFSDISSLLGSQKGVVKWYLKSMYNKMDKGTLKAQKRLDKYLGHKVYSQVKKVLPQFREPEYAKTSNYMRAGIPIVLQPDAEYKSIFPDDPKKTFMHHAFKPYEMMIKKYYLENTVTAQ